jgi:hypothetical protein
MITALAFSNLRGLASATGQRASLVGLGGLEPPTCGLGRHFRLQHLTTDARPCPAKSGSGASPESHRLAPVITRSGTERAQRRSARQLDFPSAVDATRRRLEAPLLDHSENLNLRHVAGTSLPRVGFVKAPQGTEERVEASSAAARDRRERYNRIQVFHVVKRTTRRAL